jgi:hypothetical protein
MTAYTRFNYRWLETFQRLRSQKPAPLYATARKQWHGESEEVPFVDMPDKLA